METTGKRDKILLVDDEPTNLKLLRGILQEEYDLLFAGSCEEMLRYAAEGPDLILLDVMMPGMDGCEGCTRLKANEATRHIPVIFVTARIEVEDEIKGFAVGAVDYITKPVQSSIVRARVKTHLALKHSREVIEQQNLEIRSQYKALLEAARLRDDMEQMVRHDLKGPLNAVIGMPSYLIDVLEPEEKIKETLLVIQDAGFRMLEMINRSHDLYKMERGTYQLEPQPVDLMVTLRRITAELHTPLTRKGLSIAVSLDGHPVSPRVSCIVAGEELLCHSMLSNLLKNAIEASPRDESLSISLEMGERATLRMSNKGSVPEEIVGRFFEKNVTAGKSRGVGLGTYSARLMATTLGGDIRLDMSREGEITIVVRLPLWQGK
ncbi:MAG: hybrid sensor histidine kinase/response regulator [Magnetococcus sp. YQC-3]